ncbi:glycerol kinase GlpK [Apibacter raozihei]|uniref:glycerol kinase GlpK n=1 Tax=Apibacter raozihei TaxID=2500547 RepID=UPI000FE33191|nr:glycerol kinase GlpK [Apibacter raozihei]
MKYFIAIDQSTSATKAILFNKKGQVVHRENVPHQQYYPKAGWVEHDAEEIFENTLLAVRLLLENNEIKQQDILSVSITNQRETVVVWDKNTGKPVYHAIVWQCQRGASICEKLKNGGYENTIKEKAGLLVDPYFSASGVQWILEEVKEARLLADKGELLMGTMDSWLIWKLTQGKVHATDYTNASRTLLFNIHTCNWDEILLELFSVPPTMLPEPRPSDSVYGNTTFLGYFTHEIPIAGVIGDSHGALVGQMCYDKGMGKATYGTGSSVMINIGETPQLAPEGLVTSVGFAACNKVYYVYEGNIHCTGATLNWLKEEVKLIEHRYATDEIAYSIPDNGGVYLVPAFAGLGAPWWNSRAKAIISGLTLGTGKAHIVRAALEAIAYQIKDLIDVITQKAAIELKELRVDGGPTKNKFLMQFQSDMINAPINKLSIEEASAFGAVIMGGLGLKVWKDLEEVSKLRGIDNFYYPTMENAQRENLYNGWKEAVELINK